jgi:dipeptidyl aminopeptidase/acylaminoacyl peptidase
MSRRATLTVVLLTVVSLAGSADRLQPAAAKRAITIDDVIGWKTIGVTAVSNDGQWFAYRLAPGEGDAEVVVRSTGSDKEMRFPIGELPQPGPAAAGPQGPPPSAAALDFSEDSRWIAFASYPTQAEAQRLKRQRRPIQPGLTLVNLATGEKREYQKIRRFSFSGDASSWIALLRHPAQTPPSGQPSGGAPPSPGGAAASDRPRGTDLILRELASGQEMNIGNVADFAFTRDGKRLAWTVDAQDKAGNAVVVRDMATGVVRPLDSGNFSYERPTWTEKGDALAVLRGAEDKAYKDKLYSVVGFSEFSPSSARKTVFDPADNAEFPKGMAVSPDREPRWTEDLQALLFGIREPKRKDATPEPEKGSAAGADAREGQERQDAQSPDDSEKVDLVLWHWLDTRLQSQQEVQEVRDRAFSYLAEYRVQPGKFLRLADEDVRTVAVAPKDRWAIGFDEREYELMGNLDGRRFQDLYAIELATGARKLAARRVRWFNGPSPDGSAFLFFEDGNYQVYSMASGQVRNITQGAPVSFVDIDNDTNVVKPPANAIGWASDSESVLLSDGWDVWRVPVAPGAAVNLTANGRKDAIRYQSRFALEPPEDRDKGIDLSKPLYFRAYAEWTKKGGIARIEPGKPGPQMVMWGDAAYSRLMKPKDADRYLYTRETATEPADFYITDVRFGAGTRLTDMRPQVAPFAWTAGVTLVDYTSEKGDRLQAALFLPASYEKGKSYPTVVNFYERMSQTANTFANPSANGFNRSVYASNGYAVLMPDIKYRVNDPGMSAVWCMVPAVKAAIATGIVDPKHIGITGHSWGGYQTAFLVTQTDVFAAAVAGAPLTNMVSMYSLIYKNSGSTNQPIFESSQGRFKGGYWDNWDAYYRNSPVFFAKNVKTPLMILHNDKDGAVDFTQGVEYFNTLRRLQKPVIMLEYTGENHGLRKPANQRDYTVRMKEYFDHYLMGAPAPDWMTKGVPRLQMEEHLKQRAKPKAPAKKITTE